MPKTADYSNTIIYKITCRDPNIHDVYVGHTTNFVQRKDSHKICCTNNNNNNNCKLYRVIRNNGGWDNWKMEIIDFMNCKDLYEARKKEQEYFVLLKATLNSIEPLPHPRTTLAEISQTENVIIRKKPTSNKEQAKTLNYLIAESREMNTMMRMMIIILQNNQLQISEMMKASLMTSQMMMMKATTNPTVSGIASNVTGDHNAVNSNNHHNNHNNNHNNNDNNNNNHAT